MSRTANALSAVSQYRRLPRQLREELLYEYLDESPEPGLFEFLDWLVKRSDRAASERDTQP